ncbi:MAG: hypothetical protein AB1585_05310 [Thermodesulfobacteriota bacterium]
MKKNITITLIAISVLGFLFSPAGKAKAKNNREAFILGGVVAIFARPVLQAVAAEVICPSIYRPTQIIYSSGPYYSPQPASVPRSAYERGFLDEQLRLERDWERYEYQRGREDARRYYSSD